MNEILDLCSDVLDDDMTDFEESSWFQHFVLGTYWDFKVYAGIDPFILHIIICEQLEHFGASAYGHPSFKACLFVIHESMSWFLGSIFESKFSNREWILVWGTIIKRISKCFQIPPVFRLRADRSRLLFPTISLHKARELLFLVSCWRFAWWLRYLYFQNNRFKFL